MNEHHNSTKNLDIYDDSHFLNYLKFGTYLPGASNKKNKRDQQHIKNVKTIKYFILKIRN